MLSAEIIYTVKSQLFSTRTTSVNNRGRNLTSGVASKSIITKFTFFYNFV